MSEATGKSRVWQKSSRMGLARRFGQFRGGQVRRGFVLLHAAWFVCNEPDFLCRAKEARVVQGKGQGLFCIVIKN